MNTNKHNFLASSNSLILVPFLKKKLLMPKILFPDLLVLK